MELKANYHTVCIQIILLALLYVGMLGPVWTLCIFLDEKPNLATFEEGVCIAVTKNTPVYKYQIILSYTEIDTKSFLNGRVWLSFSYTPYEFGGFL